jgi:hypothetical protein
MRPSPLLLVIGLALSATLIQVCAQAPHGRSYGRSIVISREDGAAIPEPVVIAANR